MGKANTSLSHGSSHAFGLPISLPSDFHITRWLVAMLRAPSPTTSCCLWPYDLPPPRPLRQTPHFPGPRPPPSEAPALLCCMTPPQGGGNCPTSLSSPSPNILPGPMAYKIANSCCDHGLPRPQGPGGKPGQGNLERELLITYLPQAASKETSPHKSFHKHLAGSQESVHGSHPAIRRLLTSKLRPGSRGLCQIPLPALFPHDVLLPLPGFFSSKGPGLLFCWSGLSSGSSPLSLLGRRCSVSLETSPLPMPAAVFPKGALLAALWA